MLTQLKQGSENSSSDGLKAAMNTSTDSNSSEVMSTTAGPTTLSDLMQVQDYDGQNVTVANITQDHHRYYNRFELKPKIQYYLNTNTI